MTSSISQATDSSHRRISGWLPTAHRLCAIAWMVTISSWCDAADGVNGANIVYGQVAGRPTQGYLARPQDGQKHPAILLIHEWWGLNDDIRAKADLFAKEGYVALAIDMYGGESTTDANRARELAGEVRDDMEAAFANLRNGIEFLRRADDVDANRLASIGWCFGGGWSYEIAKNNLGTKASVIYYGLFNPADDLQKMRAAIIGHFADQDRMISVDRVNEFQAKLKTASGAHEIYIYPNTTHGFASRPADNPQYNQEAADLAWQRTLSFLRKHL